MTETAEAKALALTHSFASVDMHFRADRYALEQVDHIEIVHPHATLAGGQPEPRFGVGAMDVDVTLEGIGVVCVQPLEPQDTRLYVVFRIVLTPNFPSCHSRLEDGPRLRAITMLFRDPKAARRRFAGGGFRAKAVTGRGDNIAAQQCFVLDKVHRLRWNMDADLQ